MEYQVDIFKAVGGVSSSGTVKKNQVMNIAVNHPIAKLLLINQPEVLT